MHRRLLLSSGLAVVGAGAIAPLAEAAMIDPNTAPPEPYYGPPLPPPPPPPAYTPAQAPPPPPSYGGPQEPAPVYDSPQTPPPVDPMSPPRSSGPMYKADTYSNDELSSQVSDFFGVTAEKAGAVIERIFRDNGRPTGYIAGKEGSGAVGVGLRYGEGLLYMKHRQTTQVFWQGPSVGWDFGGNASRTFVLCYNLQYPDMIFRRFPGVEGTAYVVGGMGVNYQRAEDVTLAPIRAGVGLRLGANLGYLAYSRKRHWWPL